MGLVVPQVVATARVSIAIRVVADDEAAAVDSFIIIERNSNGVGGTELIMTSDRPEGSQGCEAGHDSCSADAEQSAGLPVHLPGFGRVGATLELLASVSGGGPDEAVELVGDLGVAALDNMLIPKGSTDC